jgi:hypothetical protein
MYLVRMNDGDKINEKREKAILKSFKFTTDKPLVIKAKEPEQMNIFDFI